MSSNIFEKLTHQMTEMIESSISLAMHSKNSEVDPIHFLWALLANSNSPLNQMLNKMSVDKTAIELDVKSAVSKLPTASNVSKESMRLSRSFTHSLEIGSGEMAKNGDSFLAVDTYVVANLNNDPFKSIVGKYVDLRELAKTFEASRNENFRARLANYRLHRFWPTICG